MPDPRRPAAHAKRLFCNPINDIVRPNNRTAWFGVGAKKNDRGLDLGGLQSISDGSDCRLRSLFRRPGAVPILIIILWACAVLPNLPLRALIYEEGTNAEIARDILTRGDFLQPYVYGIRWHEKPSLLSWLIAGFATVTGGVNEWSARLPTMLSVLVTALMVQAVTRRYASLRMPRYLRRWLLFFAPCAAGAGPSRSPIRW